VFAVGWNYGPAHASDPLLGKAQSEFAIRARDALIQRRMAQISVTSEISVTQAPSVAPAVSVTPSASATPVIPDTLAAASEAPSASERTYAVASLEPVGPPMRSRFETPDPAVASQPPTADAVKATVPSSEVLVSEPVAPPAQPETAATEDNPAAEITAEAPIEPKVEAQIETKAAQVPVAPVAETKVAETQIAALTPEAPAVETPVIPVLRPAPKALTAETQATPVLTPVPARKPQVTVVQTELERETSADESTRTTRPAPAVSAPAPVQTATQASAPAVAAAPQPPVKVARKTVQAPCPARVNSADRGYGTPREGYQSRIQREYGIPRDVIRSGMSALRARDPQLAAMIARYM
jgi:hypothetical protein